MKFIPTRSNMPQTIPMKPKEWFQIAEAVTNVLGNDRASKFFDILHTGETVLHANVTFGEPLMEPIADDPVLPEGNDPVPDTPEPGTEGG